MKRCHVPLLAAKEASSILKQYEVDCSTLLQNSGGRTDRGRATSSRVPWRLRVSWQ